MKKMLGIALPLALVISLPLGPVAADQSDYLTDISLQGDQWLVLASDKSREGVGSYLALQPGGVEIGGTRGDWIECASIDEPACSSPEALKKILAWSLLPICETSSDSACLEGLSIGGKDEELRSAQFIREETQRISFPRDVERNLLEGAGVPVFESQNIFNASGNKKFAVAVRASQLWDKAQKRFYVDGLEAQIIPYFLSNNPSSGASGACAFIAEASCARASSFIPGTKLQVSFRIPNSLGGWFSGRMKDPTISVSPFNSELNTVTIASEAVEVAALGLVKEKKSFSLIENTWVENNGRWFTNGGTATGANSWQENIFPFIENYRAQVKDTAIGTDLVWKMRTIAAGPGSGCLADKSQVLGIVTTNALGYDIGSPSFEGGYLEYKVAGLHYLPNGKDLVIGTYDLVIKSETARCLYGFTKAPVSATVQVLGGDNENVATTIVSEKDGWLKLAAYGFTFSEKEIQIKLSQPFTKTITKFSGSAKALSSKQKAEIKAGVAKAEGNPKFICTGTYVRATDKVAALVRARAVCSYAKSLDKNHSYFAQAKQTKAASYDSKVMLVSK